MMRSVWNFHSLLLVMEDEKAALEKFLALYYNVRYISMINNFALKFLPKGSKIRYHKKYVQNVHSGLANNGTKYRYSKIGTGE